MRDWRSAFLEDHGVAVPALLDAERQEADAAPAWDVLEDHRVNTCDHVCKG